MILYNKFINGGKQMNTTIIIIFIATIAILILYISIFLHFFKPAFKHGYKISTKNIPDKFNELYQSLYNSNIYSLEKSRLKIVKKYIFLIIILLSFIPIYYYTSIEFKINNEIYLFSLPGFLLLYFILRFLSNISKDTTQYANTYKNIIIPNFINILNPSLIYKPNPNTDIILNLYNQASFDNYSFNRSYIDDYIEGFYTTNNYITICNIQTKFNRHPMFNGIFSCSNLNKYITSDIQFSTHNLQSNSTLNKINNKNFKKYFNIYSEDTTIVDKILTSELTNILIAFYNKYYINFDIVIRNDKLYIRFLSCSIFEPKIFRSSLHKKSLYKYYCILEFVYEMNKKLNEILDNTEF